MKFVLIILAGGQATRMDVLGKTTPKSLFPIFNTTLLRRQIQQAIDSDIKNIIVSTNQTFYKQIKIALSDLNVSVVSNPFHKKGSLDALLKIISDNRKFERIIMSFADIYFLQNPFINIRGIVEAKEIFLLVSEPFNKLELRKGGVVFGKNSIATRIIERPLPSNNSGNRWSGIAIFDSSLGTELRRFVSNHPGLTEEDFFEDVRKKLPIKISTVTDFINVNRPHQLLLATLYQAIETMPKKNIDISYLSRTAAIFRKQALENYD